MPSISQVKCVKISHSHGPYNNITLPSTDPIFANTPTPTSALWAFPLVIRRVSSSSSRFDNQHITWLMIDDETEFAPSEW
ncbi:hypothetical protein MMC14_003880 [Varicellaria rhodocarpa]|nr:hypothetical protein [Varicellaria rhodocarpa]